MVFTSLVQVGIVGQVEKGDCMKNISVMSGGGIKGVIQAEILAGVEKDLGPLHEYYDLMCGSSVGAINSAILATGKVDALQLANIYPNMLKTVFKKHWYPHVPRYDRKNFERVWDRIIGKDFKMKDCKTKLQITSVDVCTMKNHFFKSWEDKDERKIG